MKMRALMKDTIKKMRFTHRLLVLLRLVWIKRLILTQSKEVIDFSDDSERNAK